MCCVHRSHQRDGERLRQKAAGGFQRIVDPSSSAPGRVSFTGSDPYSTVSSTHCGIDLGAETTGSRPAAANRSRDIARPISLASIPRRLRQAARVLPPRLLAESPSSTSLSPPFLSQAPPGPPTRDCSHNPHGAQVFHTTRFSLGTARSEAHA